MNKQLLRYNNEIRGVVKHRGATTALGGVAAGKKTSSVCYGCVETFSNNCIGLIGEACNDPSNKTQFTSLGLVDEIVNFNLRRGGHLGLEVSTSVLCSLVLDNKEATHQVHSLVKRKLDFFQDSYLSVDVSSVIGPEVNLLTKLCLIEDLLWEERLKTVFEIFFRSIDKGSSNPIVLDKIILPALAVITQLCIPTSEGSTVGHIPQEEKAPEVSYKEWMAQPPGPVFEKFTSKMVVATTPSVCHTGFVQLFPFPSCFNFSVAFSGPLARSPQTGQEVLQEVEEVYQGSPRAPPGEARDPIAFG